ncbi:hypothetical protein ABB37_07997 [Leptomonas pyrrhocoris]|uniref:Uncharacterized protein n=1 Tax=Leptomonas pyrrhocoris TaxID=157538 RepID=A0A0M9FUC0_LEPPY|nr:hypothetical protein ABB37_07997 [Leptomonas pyrrhocoris]KPA76255.1 hypothetical protein ABB37_07997 [Leptomonas pyrrhocoris]|eukprot:XP_015654694.1 hypothetical protein ABB37_07997 [Leptomonas pyrrhocoris]
MRALNSAGAVSMVVVVDVVDTATANNAVARANTPENAPDADHPIERLEIDVDVTPYTTADALLADVEAALEEMECFLCVPRSAAALAAGHVLPPLSAVELAMRSAVSSASSSEDNTLVSHYVSALRHVRGAAALARGALRIGGECVCRDPSTTTTSSAPQEQQPTVWSVVPRPLGAPAESLVAVSTSTAATSGASSRLLTREEPTPSSTAAAATGEAGHAASRGTGDVQEKTPHDGAADSEKKKESENGSAKGHATPTSKPAAACPLSPHSAAASVVALEDVDVFSFRRLQAHRALVLAREETGANATSVLPGGTGAATSEEQQRLRPTLPWAAVEAAVQAEVRLLQAQHVLTDGCAETTEALKHAGHLLHDAASSLPAARARLRAAWLTAAQEETAAYQTEIEELRQATEKAEVWRAALKESVRMEVAALEKEVAQQTTVVAERDVLRSRVEQLEAQVAAAKAEEMALLQSSKAVPEKTRSPTTAAGDAAVEKRDATAKAPREGERTQSKIETVAATESAPLLSSHDALRRQLSPPSPSLSSPASTTSSSDSNLPPPPPSPPPTTESALASTHRPRATYTNTTPTQRTTSDPPLLPEQRWSGRRVPLLHADIPAAAAAAAPPPPPRRRHGRLSLERSFLSPALQEEVRAALAPDAEQSTGSTSSSPAAASDGDGGAGSPPRNRRLLKGATGYADPDQFPPPPPHPPSRRRRYQRKEDAAAWAEDDVPTGPSEDVDAAAAAAAAESRLPVPASVTPLRTAFATAYSPSPVVPGVYSQEGRRPGDSLGGASSAPRPRQAPSAPIPSPAFSRLYDEGERSTWLTAHPSQRTDRQTSARAAAAAELQQVTAALRRHIREPQPDPLEGQRLLQQVRELRRAMERDSVTDEGDGAEESTHEADARRSRHGGGGENATFVDPHEARASAAVSRTADRQPFASSSLLYDSRVPSRRNGVYRY